jgi:hypothetical protein
VEENERVVVRLSLSLSRGCGIATGRMKGLWMEEVSLNSWSSEMGPVVDGIDREMYCAGSQG